MVKQNHTEECLDCEGHDEKADCCYCYCRSFNNISNLERFERRNAIKKRLRIREPKDVIAVIVMVIGLVASVMTIDTWTKDYLATTRHAVPACKTSAQRK